MVTILAAHRRTEQPGYLSKRKRMASPASLLHPSTLAPASSRRLPRRVPAPVLLGLRSSPRRPRGVSLVSAATSPGVEKEPSPSSPPSSDESSNLSVSRGRGRGSRTGVPWPSGEPELRGVLSWKKKIPDLRLRADAHQGQAPAPLEIPFGGSDVGREPSTKGPCLQVHVQRHPTIRVRLLLLVGLRLGLQIGEPARPRGHLDGRGRAYLPSVGERSAQPVHMPAHPWAPCPCVPRPRRHRQRPDAMLPCRGTAAGAPSSRPELLSLTSLTPAATNARRDAPAPPSSPGTGASVPRLAHTRRDTSPRPPRRLASPAGGAYG